MEDWFHRVKSDELNQRFAIVAEECGLIGTANLVEINWKDRNAFHGMMIGDKNIRGKGLGTDTVMAIMRYAFEELGLERLDGSMIEYNEPSVKLYCDKCGWKVEGRKKNAYWRKNRFWDKLLVGINREDYITLITRTNYWSVS
jgi:RimJ/RimL family protein N-acetyltransferase